MHVPRERRELLDAALRHLEVLLRPQHGHVSLGHRQLQVHRGAELLAPLGPEIRPGRVDVPQQAAARVQRHGGERQRNREVDLTRSKHRQHRGKCRAERIARSRAGTRAPGRSMEKRACADPWRRGQEGIEREVPDPGPPVRLRCLEIIPLRHGGRLLRLQPGVDPKRDLPRAAQVLSMRRSCCTDPGHTHDRDRRHDEPKYPFHRRVFSSRRPGPCSSGLSDPGQP